MPRSPYDSSPMDILIEKVETLRLHKDEVLVVRLDEGTSMEMMSDWRRHLTRMLGTDNVIVYTNNNVKFLKVKLEEKLVDKLIDDELQKSE